MAEEQEHTGLVLVLVPADGDPIVAASSEPAHLTTVWMGDSSEVSEESRRQILAEARAYAASLDGPIVVPVVERGTLGDDEADVVFLEASDSLLAMRSGLLEASPTISRAMNSVEQFPEWTPHVTLGYPETPAREEYSGEVVTFDRIGVWVGGDQVHFPMGVSGPLAVAAAAAVEVDDDLDDDLDDEMPEDEPEDDEELIDRIPVHGVATMEGIPTKDGRGFRPGALSFGSLPAPLGYEYEYSHGGDNSRVVDVGTIDEMWTHPSPDIEGAFEVRWRGWIHLGWDRAAEAVDKIIAGARTGVSVIVDGIQIDVAEEREQVRNRLLAQEKLNGGEEIDDIEAMVDLLVGDGTQSTTWYSAGRVRRFDMVPTGAYQEGWIALGHQFPEEMTEEQIAASAAALADCGCTDSIAEAEKILAEALAPADGFEVVDLSGDELEMFRAAAEAEDGAYRNVSAEERKRLASEGKAMPDGSYPIANCEDLRNAIQAIGRASDPEAVKRHIRKRKSALGCDDVELPDTWSLSVMEQFASDVATGTVQRGGMTFAPGTKDGPGWITHPIPTARIRRYWVRGKGAAKIRWGVPGDFNRCRRQLVKYVQNPSWLAGLCANMHKEAIGIWPGEHGVRATEALVASAARAPLFSLVAAPAPVDASYFKNPGLEAANVGVAIEGDRMYGYIAAWNVCHVGEPNGPGVCTMAPRSATGYAHFLTGTVMTTEGPVAVGSITMGTGHADGTLNPRAAAAHYDNTGAVVADIVCGEDRNGIWYSGRIRPGVTDDEIYALLASGRLSGDWRMIGGNYELVAALVVNVPGFPIPAAVGLAASAGVGITSITAAGIVGHDEAEHEPVIVETPILEGGETLFTAEELQRARDILAEKLRAEARVAYARLEA